MAKKTAPDQQATRDDATKKRKKRAKKEARLMLQIEQSKKDVAKAQQKISRAEQALKLNTTYLEELRDRLAQLQNKGKISPLRAAEAADTATDMAPQEIIQESITSIEIDPGELYEDNPDVIEQHRAEQEPAEGRTDIAENAQFVQPPARPELIEHSADAEQPQLTTLSAGEAYVQADISLGAPEAENESLTRLPTEEQEIASGNGSVSLVTSDEHAWPPPETREELAEGIVQTQQEDQVREEPAKQAEPETTEKKQPEPETTEKEQPETKATSTKSEAKTNTKADTTNRRQIGNRAARRHNPPTHHT